MKKVIVLLAMMAVMASPGYASDYRGNEKEDSIFQKLGDLITGKYEVEKGKTIRQAGVVQVMADQIKDIKAAPLK